MDKEDKRLASKLSNLTQEAYIEITKKKYDEELKRVVTNADRKAFVKRWEKIADKLADGWILDIENI